MTPQEFVTKWRESSLKESAGSQEHFIDLCRMLGEKTLAESDSSGNWYAFEKGATKTGGGEKAALAISALRPYARNARTHSPKQIAQIAASIREFSFNNPVLVDRDGEIVAGKVGLQPLS